MRSSPKDRCMESEPRALLSSVSAASKTCSVALPDLLNRGAAGAVAYSRKRSRAAGESGEVDEAGKEAEVEAEASTD